MAIDTRSDTELVTAWVSGDQSAFAAVYDRYSDALYAFAVSRLRDPAAAADAVQDTFLRAARRVDQLRDPTRLRAWLYAIARNQVIDAVRRPDLLATTELDTMTSDDRDLADVVAASDAAALLRDAALGLNDRDQELLDLHLRHGLDGADLADVAGLSRPQSYVAMNRLRARLAKAVGVVLVARHGSRDCTALGQLLRDWDGRFTLEVRSRVTRHVEGCPACSERRKTLVGAVQLAPGLLGLPVVVAPALLRDTTIERVAALRPGLAAPPDPAVSPGAPVSSGVSAPGGVVTSSPGGSAEGWRRDGFPEVTGGAGRRRAVILIAAAVIVVAILGGVAFSRRDGGSEADAVLPAPAPTPAVTAPSSIAAKLPPTTTTVAAASPTTLAPPTSAASTVPTAVVDTASTGPDSVPVVGAPDEPGLAPSGGVAPAGAPAGDESDEADAPDGGRPDGGSEGDGDDAGDTPPEPTDAPPDPTGSDTTLVVPPPPPPPAPDPGHIAVVSGPIGLGASAASGTLRIRNDGGQATSWNASTGHGAFWVSPASGSLEPGQEADIAVSVDRSALPEGVQLTHATIGAANGGGSVEVAAAVERPPVITGYGRTPATVRTSNVCGPTLVSITLAATDESGIGSVAVQWSPDGMFAQLTNLTPVGSGAYTGQAGSFTSVGSHTLKAIVTDVRGNTTSQTITVNVAAC